MTEAATGTTAAELRVAAGLRGLSSVVQVVGTTIAVQGLGLVTGALVARLLSVDALGQLAAIVLWASVVGYLGDLGLPLAYVYETARDRTQIPALLGNALLIMAVQWTVLFGLGSLIVVFALRDLGTGAVVSAEIYLFVLLPMHFSRYLASISHGERDYARLNAIRLSLPIGYLLALVTCAATGHNTVRWMLACSLFSLASTLLVCGWLVVPRYRRLLGPPRPSRELLGRTLRYGLKAHIGNLTPVDSLQIDLMLVVALLSARDAGLYTVAASAALVVRVQATALGVIALAEVAATRDADAQRRRIAALTRLTAAVSVAGGLALCVLAQPLLVLVYGRPYAPAASVLRILALGMAAAATRQVLGDALRAAGRPAIPTIAEIASWPVGLVALFLLVPALGVQGAAWGVSAAYVAALALNLALARSLGLTPRFLLVPGHEDVQLVRAIATVVVSKLRLSAFNG